jgi:cytochrome P450
MGQIHDNLLDPDVVQDPYSYFYMLREEDPVHWNEQFEGWILTKYKDVSSAFHDSRFSAERMKPSTKMEKKRAEELSSAYSLLSKWMVFNDPPKHTRLRMLANKAFTPRAINKLEPRITEISDYLIDQIEDKKNIDLIQDYAYALPILVISEMLGLPKEDQDIIKQWSDDLAMFVFGATNVNDRHEKAKNSLENMADYLSQIVEDRKKNPKDDLITLIAQTGEEGDQLTTEEITSTCTLLVFGGHETTTNLIANGVFSLLTNGDELEKLKNDFDLMPTAVEEFLRYEGPSKAMIRIAKEDMEIRGKKIRKGDRLLLVQASANRDPDKFTNSDLLDIGRTPNPHLGFGRGIHYCLGAPLARLEGQIGIEKIIRRFPNICLTSKNVEWLPTMINRGLKELRVQLNV